MANNPNAFDIFGMTVSGGGDNYNPAQIFLEAKLNKSDETDLLNLIRGGYFETMEEINNLVMFYSQCVRTGNMAGIADIKQKENAKAALRGAAKSFALQAGTNTIAPDVILDASGSKPTGLRKLFRRNRRNDKYDNNGYHQPQNNNHDGSLV